MGIWVGIMNNIYLVYRISDGRCVNAIVYDGSGSYTPDENYALVLREGDAWAGWTYDPQTNTFTAPIEEGENGEEESEDSSLHNSTE